MPHTLTVQYGTDTIEVIRHKSTYTHATVTSSKPDQPAYDVALTKDFGRCTCRGSLFRGKCRHITNARAGLGLDAVKA